MIIKIMLWLAIDDVIALMSNSVCFGMILIEVVGGKLWCCSGGAILNKYI